MARRTMLKRDRVPFLHERVIEEHAELLLAEYTLAHGEITIPVPLDDIVELHLKLEYEIDDLRARFGSPDVLGAIWFNENIIRIDASLDPHNDPRMRGRFNFTLAHEIAHWRLHRQHLRGDPNEASLFEANGKPAFVCRSSDKPPEEVQADKFAGRLLMPRKLLRSAWSDWRGTDDPAALTELDVPSLGGDQKAEEHAAMERFCRPLADRFGVSAQAMRIRLQALGLLVKEIEPRLF